MTKKNRKALERAYQTGLACEKAGDIDGAATAFAKALTLDPDDHGGVAVRLAALGRGPTPPRAPMAYVATLFDQHAEDFEEILVAQLGYRTPQDLLDALTPLGPFTRLLDLGCGTGLAAVALAGLTTHRTGVDLSEGMLDLADDKGVYDELFVGDAEGFLVVAAEQDERWDLIVAADVAPYLGALDGLFAAAAARLNPGGVLALSTELAGPDVADFHVCAGKRFAHAEGYLRATLTAAGFEALSFAPVVIRQESDAPVQGQLVLARRPAVQGAR